VLADGTSRLFSRKREEHVAGAEKIVVCGRKVVVVPEAVIGGKVDISRI
jgi:hypothetical protein